MGSTTHNDGLALLQCGAQAPAVRITEAHLAHLPAVAQRYLRAAKVVGKETIRTVRLTQQGVMRQQPDQKWLPLVADQYITTQPPAFLWHAMLHPVPFASLSATDRFSDGHGALRIRLWSCIPLGQARGLEMDQGELQRYLGEMAWYPTAWLSEAIQWQALDATSVQATLRHQGITASVVLHVDTQGQLTHLTAERYLAQRGRYRLEPWSVDLAAYQEVAGMQIPTQVAVTWHLASGDFTWLRVEITEIEYNQSGAITMQSSRQSGGYLAPPAPAPR